VSERALARQTVAEELVYMVTRGVGEPQLVYGDTKAPGAPTIQRTLGRLVKRRIGIMKPNPRGSSPCVCWSPFVVKGNVGMKLEVGHGDGMPRSLYHKSRCTGGVVVVGSSPKQDIKVYRASLSWLKARVQLVV
jgi:hypothetical protein